MKKAWDFFRIFWVIVGTKHKSLNINKNLSIFLENLSFFQTKSLNIAKKSLNISKKSHNISKKSLNISKKSLSFSKKSLNISKKSNNIYKKSLNISIKSLNISLKNRSIFLGRYPAGRSDAVWQDDRVRRRQLQHLLLRDRRREACAQGRLRRPRADCRRYSTYVVQYPELVVLVLGSVFVYVQWKAIAIFPKTGQNGACRDSCREKGELALEKDEMVEDRGGEVSTNIIDGCWF